MSADNWDRCPRCYGLKAKLLEEKQKLVDASYGVLTVEEFDKARADLVKERVDLEDSYVTFREDYEIFGAETGVVTVSYKGQCTKCGLSLKFQEDHPIPGV